MKIKKIFLLSFLVLLILGVSYATEANNDTATAIDTPEVVKDSTTTTTIENSVKEEINSDKVITKQITENKTTKTSGKTYDVTNFDSLQDALTSDSYDTVTVNIKSNIKLTGTTYLSEAIKKLKINGNGKTIDGNENSFLFIDEGNTVTINNINIKNCLGYAITNYGSLTLTNSVFESNNGYYYLYDDGELYTVLKSYYASFHNYEGKLVVNNCTFNNTHCYIGSAISAIRSDVSITKSKFIGNTEKNYGGTVFNWQSYLNITESSFKNNVAYTGGAVFNYQGFVKIVKSVFDGNNATDGGAIINSEGDLNLSNNTFINNIAENRGGAIANKGILHLYSVTHYDVYGSPSYTTYHGDIYGNLITDKNIFINNSAVDGGAIYTNITTAEGLPEIEFDGRSNVGVQITNNEFTTNTAEKGGAILISEGTDNAIKNNVFSKNKAENTGKAILSYGDDVIENNMYDTSIVFNSIYTNINTESTITYNTFKDKISTTVTINTINNAKYNDNVTIQGTFKDENGNSLPDKIMIIILNSVKYSAKTNSKGQFSLTITAKEMGKNNVTVIYKGDNQYSESNNKATFIVKQPTMMKYANMANVEIGSTVKIVGRLVSNVTGQAIKYASVTVKVNDETYKLKTNGAGYVTMNYTVNDYNIQKITFKYNGNSLNLACSNSTSFNVKQPTWIKVAYMSNVEYGSTVKIVGRLLNGSTAVKYKYVNVTVNNKVYKVKTDGAGYIRLNYTVNNYNDQKITFKFAGNTLYTASSNSTTFKVKTKTSSKSYDVTDFNTLHNALTTDKYDTVTINIKSDITLTGNTTLNEAIKTLTINGNGKTINGQKNYQLLKINSNNVTIKNIKIVNCKAENGGAIENLGTLNVYNSIFTENIGEYGGAIANSGTLNIYNSTFTNHPINWDGGAINNGGTANVYNSTFINNSATSSGGGLCNFNTAYIYDSVFINNYARGGGALYNHDGTAYLYVLNSTFSKNNAGWYGGAIGSWATTDITNCVFSNNTASDGNDIKAMSGTVNIVDIEK